MSGPSWLSGLGFGRKVAPVLLEAAPAEPTPADATPAPEVEAAQPQVARALRLGLLGPATDRLDALMQAIHAEPRLAVTAVADPDGERGEGFARRHALGERFTSYEALIRRAEVDAVCLAGPSAAEDDLVIAALEAGRHVLCARPLRLNWHQWHWLRVLAERHGRVVLDGYRHAHHPLMLRMRELVADDRIGAPRSIRADLNAPAGLAHGEFALDLATADGALAGLGVHGVHWARTLVGAELQSVEAVSREFAASAVDLRTRATLAFPGGLRAEVACDVDTPLHGRLEVEGERGRLLADVPGFGVEPRIVIEAEGGRAVETFSGETSYAAHLRAFVEAVDAGALTSVGFLQEALRQSTVIDQIGEFGRVSLAGASPAPELRLSEAELRARVWRFGRREEAPYAEHLTLLEDGRIGGHPVEMERRWAVEDGRLVFFDWLDRRSTVFSEAWVQPSGRLTLLGAVSGASGGEQHQLTERAPVEALCPTADGAHLVRRPAVRRRNLLIIRAGEQSLHLGWARDISEADRNWDLYVSWYGAPEALAAVDLAEYATVQNAERKYAALYRVCGEGSPVYDYDYIAAFDDDLQTSWSGMNKMFALMREHRLDLAQPSLAPEGFIAYPMLRRQDDWTLRYTSFVEGMCPVFSREALRRCAPSFKGSISGFGVDNVWPKLLGEPKDRIAVLDKVSVVHTRPTGTNYSIDRGIAEGNELQRRYSAGSRVEEYGGIKRAVRVPS